MKNIVRALVLVLTVSGSAAFTQINNSSSTSKSIVAKTNSMPVPTCEPDGSTACGMGKH